MTRDLLVNFTDEDMIKIFLLVDQRRKIFLILHSAHLFSQRHPGLTRLFVLCGRSTLPSVLGIFRTSEEHMATRELYLAAIQTYAMLCDMFIVIAQSLMDDDFRSRMSAHFRGGFSCKKPWLEDRMVARFRSPKRNVGGMLTVPLSVG